MMENPMSKEANELLLNLLASRVDAAGAHCSPPPTPTPTPYDPDEPDEPDEPPDEPDKKGDKTIRFL
jgi:hypothetical protein